MSAHISATTPMITSDSRAAAAAVDDLITVTIRDRSRQAPWGSADASAGVQLVDVVAGPHTIVALGEDCLVCEEGLEPGQVYVFCRDASRAGVAHESCADGPARL